ncbi:hypothetical protein MRX96_050033 [Rhipicephalus microplus]
MMALIVHSRPRTRRRLARLTIEDTTKPLESIVTYLGLCIDHRLSWSSTVKEAISIVKRAQKAVKGIFLSGRGCSPSWALLYTAAATSRLLYAFLVVALPRRILERLEPLYRGFICYVLGLPRSSQVTAILAESQDHSCQQASHFFSPNAVVRLVSFRAWMISPQCLEDNAALIWSVVSTGIGYECGASLRTSGSPMGFFLILGGKSAEV